MITLEPIKMIRDTRLSYLTAVEASYKELGYSTKLSAQSKLLEVFPKGSIVPKSHEENIIEKWID